MKRAPVLKGWKLYAGLTVLAYPMLFLGFWLISEKNRHSVIAPLDVPLQQDALWAGVATVLIVGWLALTNKHK
jgi:hypothetical protein